MNISREIRTEMTVHGHVKLTIILLMTIVSLVAICSAGPSARLEPTPTPWWPSSAPRRWSYIHHAHPWTPYPNQYWPDNPYLLNTRYKGDRLGSSFSLSRRRLEAKEITSQKSGVEKAERRTSLKRKSIFSPSLKKPERKVKRLLSPRPTKSLSPKSEKSEAESKRPRTLFSPTSKEPETEAERLTSQRPTTLFSPTSKKPVGGRERLTYQRPVISRPVSKRRLNTGLSRHPKPHAPFQDVFEYSKRLPKVLNNSPVIEANSSHISPVAHSYFTLGDNTKWWEPKIESTDSIEKDFATPAPAPITSSVHSHRPRNYAAFVLGAPRYSIKSSQNSDRERGSRVSYPSVKIGTPALQKAQSDSKDAATLKVRSDSNRADLRKAQSDSKGTALLKAQSDAKRSSLQKTQNDSKGDMVVKRRKVESLKKKVHAIKRKNSRLTRVYKKINGRVGNNSANGASGKLNLGPHGRRSTVPHPGFFRAYTPECALLTNRTYCLMDKTYPSEFLRDQLRDDGNMLLKLWRTYSPPDNSSISSRNIEIGSDSKKYPRTLNHEREGAGYPCSSRIMRKRLSKAKNTRGEWKMIVNVESDGNEPQLLQTTVLEE